MLRKHSLSFDMRRPLVTKKLELNGPGPRDGRCPVLKTDTVYGDVRRNLLTSAGELDAERRRHDRGIVPECLVEKRSPI